MYRKVNANGRLLGRLEPPPVRHLIGHLQSNKIKLAIENFDIIHSLDSVDLARAINRRLTGKYPVLLEVNIAGETSKSGFTPESVLQAFEFISSSVQSGYPGVNDRGSNCLPT